MAVPFTAEPATPPPVFRFVNETISLPYNLTTTGSTLDRHDLDERLSSEAASVILNAIDWHELRRIPGADVSVYAEKDCHVLVIGVDFA